MKNAYLVLTDLHYNCKKEHRLNYFSEVIKIVTQVLELGQKYQSRGYTPYLIMLGDVIDTSINSADEAMRCLDLFRFISSQFERIYCVLGNHEQHNIASNPFWFLVSQLEDPSLENLRKAIQPQSINPCFTVPDVIIDGNTRFYFNHYGVPAKIPDSTGVNIGLFHQNVGSNEICKMWGTFDNVEEAHYVQAYNYCFLGHMHLAQGKYQLNESGTCLCEWLGTCVGTNVTEVETLVEPLNVPAVLVEDGIFNTVEDNAVERTPAQLAIDYVKLEATKATKALVSETTSFAVGTLQATTLYEQVRASAAAIQLDFLVDFLSQSYDLVRAEYSRGVDGVTTTELKSEEEECV